MDKQLGFQFQIPTPPKGPLVELSFAEIEELLLRRLAEEKDKPADALWQLARFYSHSKQHEQALARLREWIQLAPDAESKAGCILAMGQTMEQVNDFPAAIRYYKEAEALEPANNRTWYFINNNLGYSLNTLGRFAEGEVYCRRAIGIEPGRPNAFKNLGIALVGQGEYAEAARCYVTATQVNAADPRAMKVLEELIAQHPELEFEFQGALESCREAVKFAGKHAEQHQPVIHRGWRKQWFLLKSRVLSLFRRLKK